jgi:hypothetical protein
MRAEVQPAGRGNDGVRPSQRRQAFALVAGAANVLARLAAPFVRRVDEHEADACVQNLKVRRETPEVVA